MERVIAKLPSKSPGYQVNRAGGAALDIMSILFHRAQECSELSKSAAGQHDLAIRRMESHMRKTQNCRSRDNAQSDFNIVELSTTMDQLANQIDEIVAGENSFKESLQSQFDEISSQIKLTKDEALREASTAKARVDHDFAKISAEIESNGRIPEVQDLGPFPNEIDVPPSLPELENQEYDGRAPDVEVDDDNVTPESIASGKSEEQQPVDPETSNCEDTSAVV